ncbi:MAG: hypothetical protein ABJB22_02075, partial [Verrucomicrobiota bacterium]
MSNEVIRLWREGCAKTDSTGGFCRSSRGNQIAGWIDGRVASFVAQEFWTGRGHNGEGIEQRATACPRDPSPKPEPESTAASEII